MKIEAQEFQVGDKAITINYRPESIGDCGVIKQVFKDNDYRLDRFRQSNAFFKFYDAKCKERAGLIIDAGANIGASVLFFGNRYPEAKIFSIEPNLMNWHLLEINTAGMENIFNFRGGVGESDGALQLVDPGRSDWGFMTTPVDADGTPQEAELIEKISINSVMAHDFAKGTVPLLVKIDIEGAERFLFQENLEWMDVFPLIIIELHDWMLPFSGTSQAFLRAVADREFDFVYSGENIFLFNRNLLQEKAPDTAASPATKSDPGAQTPPSDGRRQPHRRRRLTSATS